MTTLDSDQELVYTICDRLEEEGLIKAVEAHETSNIGNACKISALYIYCE